MSAYRVVRIELPPDSTGPIPAWHRAWTDLNREWHLEAFDHDDMVSPAVNTWPNLTDQRLWGKSYVAAVPADLPAEKCDETGLPIDPNDYLGLAFLGMPLKDNQHLVELDPVVRAAHRGKGIGSALWFETEQVTREAGRATVIAYAIHREPAEGEDRMIPATESGAVAADHITRFPSRHGFTVEQVEQQSTLFLPVSAGATASWIAEAEMKAGSDYRLLQWANRTPEGRLDAMAALYQRMSVDTPSGEVEFEEEVWDADRVRQNDERVAKSGRSYLLSAVEHVPSGALVAFTELNVPQGRIAAYQHETLVHGEHRGKRLGLWVKAANLDFLVREHPQVQRIHTWNADENHHMLAINKRIGFQVASVEGVWQHKL